MNFWNIDVCHVDDNYSGIYDDSRGDEYNGYPVYRNREKTNFVIYLHNPSDMMWVIQQIEPSASWAANSFGYGESPDVASWPEDTLEVTLIRNHQKIQTYFFQVYFTSSA